MDQTSEKGLTVSNYDKIKALAANRNTIQRFTEMLGGKSNAMSYISSAMLVVANSPDLMECAPSSVFNSVMRAAALRLSCDPATKQAHIVPFWNNKAKRREAQFIPGYVGLNQLAHRTGKYRHLNTSELYAGQKLEINQLTGVPSLKGERKSDDVVGYFHYFELFNGFCHILYMTVDELRAHGERYAPKNPMWRSDFPAMARKTVTRLHLLHDGILDPFDRSIIEQASEETEGSDIIEQGNAIDAVFTEADDETAAAEAAAKKAEVKQVKPEAKLLNELGFDAEKQPDSLLEKSESVTSSEPAQEAEAPKLEPWQMTEDTHTAYTAIDSEKLAGRMTSVAKHKPQSDEDKKRIEYIKSILVARRSSNNPNQGG